MNAFQEAIKALLIRARDEGMTRRQAAATFGMSYGGLVMRINRMGIDWPHAAMELAEPNERAKDILARHQAGETLEAIGSDYGITRERVRQIVQKAGGQSKREIRNAKLVKLAAYLKDHPMTLSEAIRSLSLPSSTIKDAANVGGVELLKISAEREAELKPLADLVKAGKSFYEAAGHDHSLEVRLHSYCARIGVKSIAPSRWSVSPKRGELIAKLYSAGKSWAEIAAAVSKMEGVRPVKGSAVYNWAVRHMEIIPANSGRIHEPKPAREPRQPKIKAIRPPKVPAEIEVRETIRETAIVNRGKATASEIAAACGTTRNAVIGHWFRARHSGVTA